MLSSTENKSAHCLLTIIYITHHFPQPIISNYPGCWCSENCEVTVNTHNSGYCFSSFSHFLMRLIKKHVFPHLLHLLSFLSESCHFDLNSSPFYVSLSCFSRVVPFSLPITISEKVGQPEDPPPAWTQLTTFTVILIFVVGQLFAVSSG